MKTDKKTRVSVIIPTYNRAGSLGTAIDSVLAQDYGNTEILVIDDGSTDYTPAMLNEYKDRIRVLTQVNKGVSAARNRGIRESTGGFIALLDSDDRWEPGKLSCQMEFFNTHPTAMICQTEEIWIRKGKRVNPGVKHRKMSGMIFEPCLDLCLVSPSAVMMRRQLFDQKGLFNESFPVCEDYDLWLRISVDTPIYLIDKPLTVKTGGHWDQLSASHSQDRYRIQSILDLMESKVLSRGQQEAAQKVLGKKCRVYGQGCIKRGRTEEGNFYLGLTNR